MENAPHSGVYRLEILHGRVSRKDEGKVLMSLMIISSRKLIPFS